MVHSGRSTPGAGDVVTWREGVGIVLDKKATAARIELVSYGSQLTLE